MGKSVKFLSFVLLFFAGCASVSSYGYINRVDHPYNRTFYAGYEKVVGALVYVLKKDGWVISEADPSIYEREERYENNGYQNLLIITDVRKGFLHFTGMRLNVFIHAIGDTCEVQIRYESQKWFLKPFISTHNDKLVRAIWDKVDAELK